MTLAFGEVTIERCIEERGVVADVVFVYREGLVVGWGGVGFSFGPGMDVHFDDFLGTTARVNYQL